MADAMTKTGPAEEQRALVERICSSRHFARSPRLREFLHYVTTRTLDHRAAELTESDIARDVFERGADFVPADDSIVRSSARQLRQKLKDYFDDEGRTEPLRLEIPRGAYVPVFVAHAEVPPPVPRDAVPPAPERRHLLWASIAANLVLLVVCLILALRPAASPGKAEAQRPTPSVLASFLAAEAGSVPVVVSDFSLAAMRHLNPRPAADDVALDHYARWDYTRLTPPAGAPPEALRMFNLLSTHRLTRSGDLALSVRILQAAGADRRLVFRHARDVSPRELRAGSHIILGNPNSTPWAEPYERHLGFQWMRGRGYRDVRAGPGEIAEHAISSNSFQEAGPGFGRIARVPNLSGQGHVLLISGLNMVTMEAAGEAALDPARWTELRRALGLAEGAALPDFEALLQTEALDNTPLHGRIVKARLIGH